MPGYIKFSISSKKINSTLSMQSRRVFNLPDGITVFSALLYNGLDIVLVSQPPERVEGGTLKQHFSIFDYELVGSYYKGCTVILTVFDLNASSYVFDVQLQTSHGKSLLGNLRADNGGLLQFNREDISATRARRLLTKALLLEGK